MCDGTDVKCVGGCADVGGVGEGVGGCCDAGGVVNGVPAGVRAEDRDEAVDLVGYDDAGGSYRCIHRVVGDVRGCEGASRAFGVAGVDADLPRSGLVDSASLGRVAWAVDGVAGAHLREDVVQSLGRWRLDVEVGCVDTGVELLPDNGSFAPGFCYLRFILPSKRRSVVDVVGAWPSSTLLLTIQRSCYDVVALRNGQWRFVADRSGRAHVIGAGEEVSVGSSRLCVACHMDRLACLYAKFWGDGSLGKFLADSGGPSLAATCAGLTHEPEYLWGGAPKMTVAEILALVGSVERPLDGESRAKYYSSLLSCLELAGSTVALSSGGAGSALSDGAVGALRSTLLLAQGDGGIGPEPVAVSDGCASEGESGLSEAGPSDSSGGSSQVGGESKLERNRRWRRERAALKRARRATGADVRLARKGEKVRAFPRGVDESWVARKNAENALKEAQAKHQLELLKARDLEAEKRRQATWIRVQAEKNMVAIERAHSTLKQTGNVPGFRPGFAETVVSDDGTVLTEGASGPESPGPGTPLSIGPSSSASQTEIRACQKENLDKTAEIASLKRKLERMEAVIRLTDGKEVVFSDNGAFNPEDAVSPSVKELVDSVVQHKGAVYTRDTGMGGICVEPCQFSDFGDY